MLLAAAKLLKENEASLSGRVRFNEDVCPIDSACLAHCAVRWMEEHP